MNYQHSAHALPDAYRKLMVKEDSIIADFYPPSKDLYNDVFNLRLAYWMA